MKCKICGSKMHSAFKQKVFNKYQVEYFVCDLCDYLCTEEPYWLEETYAEDDIFDTGAVERNHKLVFATSVIIDNFFNKNKKFIDFGGGAGLFVRSMRDKGFDFYLDEKYRDNCFARGFEYNEDIKDIECVTAFEVLEHLPNPMKEIKKLLNISDNLIFTTAFKKEKIPNLDWFYYAFMLGQHISFYSEKTFQVIAKKFNTNFYSCKGVHILTKKKINKRKLKKILKNKERYFKKIKLESRVLSDFEYLKNQKSKNH